MKYERLVYFGGQPNVLSQESMQEDLCIKDFIKACQPSIVDIEDGTTKAKQLVESPETKPESTHTGRLDDSVKTSPFSPEVNKNDATATGGP